MGFSGVDLPDNCEIDLRATAESDNSLSESQAVRNPIPEDGDSSVPDIPTKHQRGSAIMLSVTDVITSLFLLIWLILCGIMLIRKREMWRAGAAAAAFEVVSLISQRLSGHLIPATKTLSGIKLNLWHNTVVSYCHSLTAAGGVILVFAVDFSTFGRGMYSGHGKRAYTVVCISCGYLAYDLWDTLRKRLYNPKAPSILAHNAILLVCFTTALYRDVTVNYLILTLVCETNSIFLHHRRLLSLGGVSSSSRVNRLNWKCLWITFFATRIVAHGIIPPWLIYDSRSFPSGVEFLMALCGTICFNLLNVELGRDLLKAQTREGITHDGDIFWTKVSID